MMAGKNRAVFHTIREEKMKAIVCEKYGPVESLVYKEVEKPVPQDNEVLIRVHGSSVNFNILGLVRVDPYLARLWFGFSRPKYPIPGNDVAGQVEAVGRNVTRWIPGDAVFGDLSDNGFGAFAEYACAKESALARKPANISFEEAAVVPEAGLVALHALRDKGRIQAGQKVLIYGASGGIGTFAVQIAKSCGAEVTGICGTGSMEMVRSLGADRVIDYTKEDFGKQTERYDLIVATAGYRSIFDYQRALNPEGIYVATGGSMRGPKAMAQIMESMLLGPLMSMAGGKKMGNLPIMPATQSDYTFLTRLIETGKVKPVIDRRYPLSKAVEGLRYYEKGHAKGKVAITVSQ
jgi:NADPH:quinone reductase-like Zn-dependent oxidoreductase